MADASFVQTDFRSGVWSQMAQGHLDDRDYRRGMNVCFNGYPIEEGAWTRRPGSRHCGYTRGGLTAWLQAFHFSQSVPYNVEFTNAHAQIWNGVNLVFTNDPQQVTNVSTANPAVVTTAGNHGWSTGDRTQFLLTGGVSAGAFSRAMNRRFTITVISATTFSIVDEVTGNTVDGSTFTAPKTGVSVARVLDLASPYTTQQLTNINSVIAEILVNNKLQGQLITLHPSVAPQVIAQTGSAGGATFANFTLNPATFTDGPYFDPQPTGTLIASALTGTITLSGAPANTFVSTDVGRMIRLFSEPANWASGTGYSAGNVVKFNGLYYTALGSSTGKQPDQTPASWAINPSGAIWTWGVITTVDSGTQVHFTINGPNLLYGGSSTPIVSWRLGLYSNTTGWPTCGVFHEGRLWLAGAQPNRFDASVSNQPYNFAPTASDGTVADNLAIGYVLNSDDQNLFEWMTPDHQGIVAGTAAGEWLISASQLSDPLTPTSIQAKRVTKYKCANVQPVRAGLSLMFVQAQAHRLLEYTSDVFSGKFMARNVTDHARHLTGGQIKQIGYQQDLSPHIWSMMLDGTWAGMAYKRESQFTSEPPTFYGWHSHALGSGRVVESISVGPNVDGTLEALQMVTNDPTTNIRHVELLTDQFDQTTPLALSWFLDDAIAPASVVENVVNNTVTIYGLTPHIGKTVTVVAAGLDLGDYVVAADGSVVVPLGGAAQSATVGLGLPLFTDAFFNSFVGIQSLAFSTQVNRTVTVTHSSAVSQTFGTYHDTSIVTGANIDKIFSMQDFQRNEFHAITIGNTNPSAGWVVYNRQTNALKRAFTHDQIFGSTNYAPGSNTLEGPYALDDNGYAYWFSGLGNNDIIRKMNTNTGQIVASFGVSASSFNNDNNFITPGRSFTTIKVWQEAVAGLGVSNKPAGYRNYLLSCPIVSNGSFTVLAVDDITLNGTTVVTLPDGDQFVVPDAVQANKMQWAGFASTITEKFMRCATGQSYTNGKQSFGDIWIMGEPATTSAAFGFYRVRIAANAANFDIPPGPGTTNTNPAITMVRTGGITPAQIDATWTNITNVGGIVYDRTDGNLIAWFQTSDAVTNKQYIVKINPGTPSTAPSVVWATPLTAAGMYTQIVGANSFYVGYGTIAWNNGQMVYSVTTAAGVLVTTAVAASPQIWNSYSDDRDAMIFLSDGSQIWHNLINVNGFSSQSSITTDYALPVMPVVVGFNYVSNGQILRPVAPDATGARNGPGWAKTRRAEKMGIQLLNTQQISVGSKFDSVHLHPLELRSENTATGPVIPNITTLASGIFRTEIDADYDFDNMLCWQSARPYPATVTAVGGFLETQDL